MPATPAHRQRRYNFYLNFIIYAKTNFSLFIDLYIFYSVVDEENIDNTICTKEYISIKNTKQLHCVFILGTFILESRNKNYSAPIGSMGNYLLSTESFM